MNKYPITLVQKYPADKVWVQGSQRALALLDEIPKRGLAVVGTRRPTPRSVHFTQEVLSDIARTYPLVIVSGLARGIDSAAHEAALRFALPTVAILGCGLNQQYPPENAGLRERILRADGLIISEYESETPPLPGQFLKRNRLIAAWSSATWVVEAGFRSGALNTASHARDFDRKVFATPAFPGDTAFAGNEILLDERDPQAYAVFAASSFGHEWISLATASKKKKREARTTDIAQGAAPKRACHPVTQLIDRVELEFRTRGGITKSQLLEWATDSEGPNWTRDEFFQVLQFALSERQIIDANGLLLKNLISSD